MDAAFKVAEVAVAGHARPHNALLGRGPAISEINTEQQAGKAIHIISGQCVPAASLPGIYIVGGKKYIVK